MPIPHPSLPKVPAPTKIFFDPFNSSSTGHQRAENRLSGSTSWRDSRTYKLANQFQDSSGRGGTRHLSDLVGAGSKDFGKDGRKENSDRGKNAPGPRQPGWQNIRGLMSGPRKRSLDEAAVRSTLKKPKSALTPLADQQRYTDTEDSTMKSRDPEEHVDTMNGVTAEVESAAPSERPPQIFRGLTIYLNGSTAPLISDHKLKKIFVSYGGNVCLGLARRFVTHVIIGKTGLAAGKIQKEVRKISGESVKYVTAQWVIDSVEAGKRKPEGPYLPEDLGIGGSRQKSVRYMFAKPKDG